MATTHGTKAVVAALLANSAIAVTKFIAFLLTGISSMLAEAIHSVADASNQGLLLLGGRKSRRVATEEHPFGYGRERYIYAFIVSIVLFTLGGLFALYEAFHKFDEIRSGQHTETGQWWWVPIVVLVVAIGLEIWSFRTAIEETDKVRGDASYWQFVRHSKQPELPVILLEDLAALVGLVLALVAVVLSLLTGNYYFDVAGTALIGILLVVVAVILAIETKSLLLGESATPSSQEAIVAALSATPDVERIIHFKTLHLGPEELLVVAKIAVRQGITAEQIAVAIDTAENSIRAVEPMARVIYLEPDIFRADYMPPEQASVQVPT